MQIKLNRFQLLRFILPAALLAGIFLSLELWFPAARTFPRAPLFIALPAALIFIVERSLSAILIISLILIIVKRRLRISAIIAIASLCLLIIFDQMRLQPWVYQYLLLLIILTLNNWPTADESASNNTLAQLQLIVAALYWWSGIQKLNFTFIHETLPIILSPLKKILLDPPLVVIGVSIALAEIFIGFGLLFARTRKVSIALATATHLAVLSLLIAKRYNSVVWAWNFTLIVLVVLLFWQSETACWQLFINWRTRTIRLAQSLAVGVAVMPIFSFCGLWDMYPSGALYSGNTVVGVLHIDEDSFKQLPSTAQQQVFKTSRGEQMLPLLEWSMSELNVPPYPEVRVYRQVTREVCRSMTNSNRLELVMKERPTIFDGSYQITRIGCDQIK